MNQDKTEAMSKPRCNACLKYTDKKSKPQCTGHGASSGSSGGEASGDKAAHDDAKSITQTQATIMIEKLLDGMTISKNLEFTERLIPTLELDFNSEAISDLITNELLLITNDKDNGTLSISLQCHPRQLADNHRGELEKYVNAILNVMSAFKQENGINADCYRLRKDKDGNFMTLHISLLSPALYDTFIQRLQNLCLLPLIRNNQHNQFHPTPISTKLTASGKKNEDNDVADPNQSIRPKSPLDGLKPKGWVN